MLLPGGLRQCLLVSLPRRVVGGGSRDPLYLAASDDWTTTPQPPIGIQSATGYIAVSLWSRHTSPAVSRCAHIPGRVIMMGVTLAVAAVPGRRIRPRSSKKSSVYMSVLLPPGVHWLRSWSRGVSALAIRAPAGGRGQNGPCSRGDIAHGGCLPRWPRRAPR